MSIFFDQPWPTYSVFARCCYGQVAIEAFRIDEATQGQDQKAPQEEGLWENQVRLFMIHDYSMTVWHRQDMAGCDCVSFLFLRASFDGSCQVRRSAQSPKRRTVDWSMFIATVGLWWDSPPKAAQNPSQPTSSTISRTDAKESTETVHQRNENPAHASEKSSIPVFVVFSPSWCISAISQYFCLSSYRSDFPRLLSHTSGWWTNMFMVFHGWICWFFLWVFWLTWRVSLDFRIHQDSWFLFCYKLWQHSNTDHFPYQWLLYIIPMVWFGWCQGCEHESAVKPWGLQWISSEVQKTSLNLDL